MKKHFYMVLVIVCFGFIPAHSQFIGIPKGPQFDAAMRTIFGKNRSFVANAVMEIKNHSGKRITFSAKVAHDSGNIYEEMKYSDVQGLSPRVINTLKSGGLNKAIAIRRRDEKVAYDIFPGIHSYFETPMSDTESNLDDIKVEITKVGKEKVAGHLCLKNKVMVTENHGHKGEVIVWDAPDLRNFPIKIEMSEQDHDITIHYSNITFQKPAASLFEPPAGYTKFNNMQDMIRANRMKIRANAERNTRSNSIHSSKY